MNFHIFLVCYLTTNIFFAIFNRLLRKNLKSRNLWYNQQDRRYKDGERKARDRNGGNGWLGLESQVHNHDKRSSNVNNESVCRTAIRKTLVCIYNSAEKFLQRSFTAKEEQQGPIIYS